eukprot:1424721-Prymnesium_polylepis.1
MALRCRGTAGGPVTVVVWLCLRGRANQCCPSLWGCKRMCNACIDCKKSSRWRRSPTLRSRVCHLMCMMMTCVGALVWGGWAGVASAVG